MHILRFLQMPVYFLSVVTSDFGFLFRTNPVHGAFYHILCAYNISIGSTQKWIWILGPFLELHTWTHKHQHIHILSSASRVIICGCVWYLLLRVPHYYMAVQGDSRTSALSPSYSIPNNLSPAHMARLYPPAPQTDAPWPLLRSEEGPEEEVQAGLSSCLSGIKGLWSWSIDVVGSGQPHSVCPVHSLHLGKGRGWGRKEQGPLKGRGQGTGPSHLD